ncbi:hypothetical protein C8J57DRAFT_1719841 [Mycena rebaudengoi]|nr:hypothetical protein C8J57DRAFT_1719841 [Mycena rebaudengoi]
MSDSLIVPRKSLLPMDDLLGPWLTAIIVSSIVFGVTCLQIYLYYTKYSSRDSEYLKLLVGFIMLMDTLHLVFISMLFYETTVTNFGDFTELGESRCACPPMRITTLLLIGPLAQIVVGGFLETLVQMFYAVRVWLLERITLDAS